MTLEGDLRQSDPVIKLEHHDPKEHGEERREFFAFYHLKTVLHGFFANRRLRMY